MFACCPLGESRSELYKADDKYSCSKSSIGLLNGFLKTSNL